MATRRDAAPDYWRLDSLLSQRHWHCVTVLEGVLSFRQSVSKPLDSESGCPDWFTWFSSCLWQVPIYLKLGHEDFLAQFSNSLFSYSLTEIDWTCSTCKGFGEKTWGKESLGEPRSRWRRILTGVFKKRNGRGLHWFGSGEEQVVGCCECGNEPCEFHGFGRGDEFLD